MAGGRDTPGGYRYPVTTFCGGSAGYPDLLGLPGVPDAVEGVREALAALHRHPANRRGWPRTAAAASVRAARASAAIEGADVAFDPDSTTVRDPMLAGALRAAASIGALAPVWQRSPLQALARLHTEAAADLVAEVDLLGRPIRRAARLSALAEMAISAPWPAPVLVAVVHGELLTLRAFGTADGLVARAAARLVAIGSGLDPHGLGVPEVAQLRAGDRYRQLADGFAEGTDNGLANWIVAGCEWLQAGAREGGSIAAAAG